MFLQEPTCCSYFKTSRTVLPLPSLAPPHSSFSLFLLSSPQYPPLSHHHYHPPPAPSFSPTAPTPQHPLPHLQLSLTLSPLSLSLSHSPAGSLLALLMAAPHSGHVTNCASWEQRGVCTCAHALKHMNKDTHTQGYVWKNTHTYTHIHKHMQIQEDETNHLGANTETLPLTVHTGAHTRRHTR